MRARISDHACVIKSTSLSNILHLWVLVSLLWSGVPLNLGFLGLILLVEKGEVVRVFLLAIRSLSWWLGVHLQQLVAAPLRMLVLVSRRFLMVAHAVVTDEHSVARDRVLVPIIATNIVWVLMS